LMSARNVMAASVKQPLRHFRLCRENACRTTSVCIDQPLTREWMFTVTKWRFSKGASAFNRHLQ
jgi:hypothetical protein